MRKTAPTILLATALLVGAAVAALAQQNTGTAGSGMVAPTPVPRSGDPATSPRAPGGTGTATVPGNASTMHGDRSATVQQKTGSGGSDK